MRHDHVCKKRAILRLMRCRMSRGDRSRRSGPGRSPIPPAFAFPGAIAELAPSRCHSRAVRRSRMRRRTISMHGRLLPVAPGQDGCFVVAHIACPMVAAATGGPAAADHGRVTLAGADRRRPAAGPDDRVGRRGAMARGSTAGCRAACRPVSRGGVQSMPVEPAAAATPCRVATRARIPAAGPTGLVRRRRSVRHGMGWPGAGRGPGR